VAPGRTARRSRCSNTLSGAGSGGIAGVSAGILEGLYTVVPPFVTILLARLSGPTRLARYWRNAHLAVLLAMVIVPLRASFRVLMVSIVVFLPVQVLFVIGAVAIWIAGPLTRPDTSSEGTFVIRILVTGGTFDKTYDEISGRLSFDVTHLPEMLSLGRSRVETTIETLMMIDSLDMTDDDRARIVTSCARCPETHIVITHGTDTMVDDARAVAEGVRNKDRHPDWRDGALRVRQLRGLFNLGSALSFAEVLPPGVYIAMNGQHFRWDRVRKNKELGVCRARGVNGGGGGKRISVTSFLRVSPFPPPPPLPTQINWREEIIVFARWLVPGDADGVGDLREVPDLVQQDVRRSFPTQDRQRRTVAQLNVIASLIRWSSLVVTKRSRLPRMRSP
jgi:L-asparaginase